MLTEVSTAGGFDKTAALPWLTGVSTKTAAPACGGFDESARFRRDRVRTQRPIVMSTVSPRISTRYAGLRPSTKRTSSTA